MAFRFAPDRPAADEVLRMARAQTDTALAGLADPEARGVAATIFDVRKRCKKARAVLRLVRGPMGEKRYRRTNVAYRDAGRALAGYRDAGAAALAFEWLLVADERTAVDLDTEAVRGGLAARRAAAVPQGDEVGTAVARAHALLAEASGRLDRVKLEADGWDLLGDGVAAVYDRGTAAVARAVRKPTPVRLHELRKQVKYTRYHLRMLRRTSPLMVLPVLDGFELVSDHLGQARDLLLLADAAMASPAAVGGDEQAARLVVLAEEQRAELETAGLGLSRRLYAEKPAAFAARLGVYWDLWVAAGPEPAGVLGPADTSVALEPEPRLTPAPVPAPAPEPVAEVQLDGEREPAPTAAVAVTMAVEPGPGSSVAAEPELEELTVTALRALARDREIVGRSRMNRAELVAALQADTGT